MIRTQICRHSHKEKKKQRGPERERKRERKGERERESDGVSGRKEGRKEGNDHPIIPVGSNVCLAIPPFPATNEL